MQVAEGQPEYEIKPAPDKALALLGQLAEYAAPKLNRTEHVGAGENGEHLFSIVERKIIK